MKRRSPLFWLILLLGLALAAWWVLHVPYAPERMVAAIPAGATFVTQHRGLVDRWEVFATNPVTRSLLSSLGIKASAMKDLKADPESEAWFRKLASKDIVLAFVPELGGYGEPAWVFASWLGGRSQRLRWSLSWGRVPGYTPQPPHRGRPCWKVESRDLDPDVTLTISFVEGLLVGCLARDPRCIGDVLDVYDGLAASAAHPEGWTSAGGGEESALDRGWFDLSGLREENRLAPRALVYEFTQLTATSLAGRLSADVVSAPGQPAPQADALDRLAGLVGDLPLAFAVSHTALVLPWIETGTAPIWARVVRDVIRQERAETAMVAVLGGEFSGRFKAIKVPAIVIGIPVAGREGVPARIRQALDRLNARYRWGLIPTATAVGSNEVYAIEGTALESHATLAMEEKPAYAVVGGWLLLGSNLGSLSRLVARYEDQGSRPAPSRWRRELGGADAPACAWVDLVQGAKTLRLALATYSLKLFLEDPQGSQVLRQRLNEAKAWVDSLAPLDTGRFWATPGAGRVDIQFKLGAGP